MESLMMSKYVTSVWLLANTIHPAVYWIFFLVPLRMENVVTFFSYWSLCYVFSLPGFLLGCMFFAMVKRFRIGLFAKFFLLVAAAIAGILLSIVLLSFVISGKVHLHFFIEQSIPAMISVVLIMSIRYESFSHSMNSENYESYSFP